MSNFDDEMHRQLTEVQLPSHIGKRIRIVKGRNEFLGLLRGVDSSVVVATSATTVGHPWRLETATKDIEPMPPDFVPVKTKVEVINFIPSDGWKIFSVEE